MPIPIWTLSVSAFLLRRCMIICVQMLASVSASSGRMSTPVFPRKPDVPACRTRDMELSFGWFLPFGQRILVVRKHFGKVHFHHYVLVDGYGRDDSSRVCGVCRDSRRAMGAHPACGCGSADWVVSSETGADVL